MTKLTNYLYEDLKLGFLQETLADIQVAYSFILGSCIMAMFVGMFWMVIMKLCVACITWTVILLILLLSTALSYYVY